MKSIAQHLKRRRRALPAPWLAGCIALVASQGAFASYGNMRLDGVAGLLSFSLLAATALLFGILLLLKCFRWWWTVVPAVLIGLGISGMAILAIPDGVRAILPKYVAREPSVEELLFVLAYAVLVLLLGLFAALAPLAQFLRRRGGPPSLPGILGAASPRPVSGGARRLAAKLHGPVSSLFDERRHPRIAAMLPRILAAGWMVAVLMLLPSLSGYSLHSQAHTGEMTASGWMPVYWLGSSTALSLEALVLCFPIGWLLGSARLIIPILALPVGASLALLLSLLLPHRFPLDAWVGPDPLWFLLAAMPSLALGVWVRRRGPGGGRTSG